MGPILFSLIFIKTSALTGMPEDEEGQREPECVCRLKQERLSLEGKGAQSHLQGVMLVPALQRDPGQDFSPFSPSVFLLQNEWSNRRLSNSLECGVLWFYN